MTSSNGSTSPGQTTDDDLSQRCWYLGYGSNMSSKVLCARRKVYPLKSIPCTVPGYYLNFDVIGIPYIEPAFASINTIPATSPPLATANQPQPELEGVLHDITLQEFEMIQQSEGGGGHKDIGYQVITVPCRTYTGETIHAKTLQIFNPPRPNFQFERTPSLRYKNILIDGAVEFKLRGPYVDWLKTIPCYSGSQLTLWNKIGKFSLLGITIVSMTPIVIVLLCYRVVNRPAPRFVFESFEGYKMMAWGIHNKVWKHVFGNGATTTLKSALEKESNKPKLS